jgi:hypothetical protein
MICIGEIIGFFDIQENDDEPPKTVSGTLVKPHKPGHNAKTLSQYAVEQFRGTLERAGYTTEIVMQVAELSQASKASV